MRAHLKAVYEQVKAMGDNCESPRRLVKSSGNAHQRRKINRLVRRRLARAYPIIMARSLANYEASTGTTICAAAAQFIAFHNSLDAAYCERRQLCFNNERQP